MRVILPVLLATVFGSDCCARASAFTFTSTSKLGHRARLYQLNKTFSSASSSKFAPGIEGFLATSERNERTNILVLSEQEMSAERSEVPEIQATPECGMILPGQVLSIRIGDTSQSRKAWKKRRRSGSPILVPCTILGMNRQWMVKWNIMTLVHMFGKPPIDNHLPGNNGVELSVGALVKLYKHRLGGNLLEHAQSFGYPTIASFIESVFDDSLHEEYGIQVLRSGPKKQLILASKLSRRLARESASKAAFVQFIPASSSAVSSSQDKSDTEENIGVRMVHTGTIQIPPTNTKKNLSTTSTITATTTPTIEPLSAAVRISQQDADSNRIYPGLECNAFMLSYDICGDNGSPLLTCAVDPPRGQIRDQMKRRSYLRRKFVAEKERAKYLTPDGNTEKIEPSKMDLNDLNVGDGPFPATVIRVSSKAGAAFVDMGVGRKMGKKKGGGNTKVLGMLRFDDMVSNIDTNKSDEERKIVAISGVRREGRRSSSVGSSECTEEEAAIIEASLMEGNDEEEDDVMTVEDLFMDNDNEDEEEETEEDVTALFSMDENGNISSVDPKTGEKSLLGSVNGADDKLEEDSDDDNMFTGMSPEERLQAIGNMLEDDTEEIEIVDNVDSLSGNDESANPVYIKMGDKVDVYVRSIFLQSARFMVTLDPSIKGRKPKEMKKEKEADKRLSRLASKMGGEGKEGIEQILNKVGLKWEGVVKAKSKSGDWYYVQPDDDKEDGMSFPVGVASLGEDSALSTILSPGDRVQIRLDGIDDSRGQLAMTLLDNSD